ncbi:MULTISPECIES: TetR/AcrR family transcriptional regulator [unclassified Nocardioides]|jgi:AcrR family transcriptional regulator|uniref:TetR/AcrR family transcriptional regulator n=1 Tax=unclassified Nocardioides TaxID=2615069 RepID=UPI00114F8753|nr:MULTISPECIES: TetR/AcrR family transcriptional regulator [unclassified Nocardioides]TQK68361.1 TetR family transcriptional regulator [Nocardioides sp. SLBN-35]WGY02325.1 TetR/AcrR family transcriptional regulator [Nocardioides sp. QY071]
MPSATVGSSAGPSAGPSRRRVPAQARSRERVERILEAAARLVVTNGVDGLTTRSIAEAAELPVASLYQYFTDKEAVLLALCERDMAEMDDQVAGDLAAVEELTVASLVDTVMRAFVKVYHRRPAFMQIWMRGRTNPAIYDYGRHHNRRTAESLLAFGIEAGLLTAGGYDEEQLATIAELAVEVGDRAFQVAFENDPRGDGFLIDQAIALVAGYLDQIATGR